MDKKNIKISIIIPCFNQENYIHNCLDSILSQSLKEFEVICVNDASTDNTFNILSEYAKIDSRIKLINYTTNKGTSQARKDAVLKSSGKYVMFVDPDDSLSAKALEIAYNAIKKQNVDILQFGTNVINVGVAETSFNVFEKNCEPFNGKLFDEDIFFSCFKDKLFNFNLWNKIYNGDLARKSFAEIVDGFYPKAQDMYAFFIMAFFAKKYSSISNKLYNYYFGRGITGKHSISLDRFSKICTQMQIIELLFLFIDKNAKNNIQKFIDVLSLRGRVFYNEVMVNYTYIEDLNNNSSLAISFLLENLSPKFSKDNYSNLEIYNAYISYLFNLYADLLYVKNLGYEIDIYNSICNVFKKQKLNNELQNNFLFNQIKSLILNYKSKKQTIPIVFATNDNYAPYLATSIQSIKENSSIDNFYDIYIFHTSLSEQYQMMLQSMSSKNVFIRTINVLPYISNLKQYSHSHYSVEMYYRILIPEILTNYNKVIYLDCDLVILDDISNLFNIDVSNYILATVHNELSSEYMKKYIVNTLNLELDQYFNSGVLLINTKKFVENNIKNLCFDFLNNSSRLMCPDQDILNVTCKNNILFLPTIWNFQTGSSNYSLFSKYMNTYKIIHYTTALKPWNTKKLELSEYFWKFAKNCPFYEIILNNYLSSTLNLNYSDKKSFEIERNIINKDFHKKHIITWPFRMTKSFIKNVNYYGLKKTLPKVKTKLKYAFNRIFNKVDIYNNKISRNNIINPIKENKIKIKDYPKKLQNWFYEKTNITFDIENPVSLSEKIQWLKIYDATLLKSHLSDKWLAKEYVKNIIGEQYIIKTYGVFDRFEDIDFDKLPNKFVIKSTHASGQIVIIKDKNLINKTELKKKVNRWLNSTYAFNCGFEMHYQNIIPRIIIEEFIETIDDDLYDYKIMCFNGKPEFIWVDTDRFTGHKRTLFDLNWKKLPVKYQYENSNKKIPKPKVLNRILELSKKLSSTFTLCRCDFYILPDGSIKFGELTFTSCSGIDRFDPLSFDYELGKKLNLPKKSTFKKLTKNQLIKSENLFLKSLQKGKRENG